MPAQVLTRSGSIARKQDSPRENAARAAAGSAPAGGGGSSPARARRQAAPGFQRAREDHARELAEDYVELIDDLIRERGEARAVDMAASLGVTHVTVANTIRRLQREGLVRSEPYRAVFLTDAGRRLAEQARRRHRLVLDFLQALGVPERVAQLDAEGIEHHLSPETLAALKRFLAERRPPGDNGS